MTTKAAAMRVFEEYADTIVAHLRADRFVPLYEAIAAAGVASDPGLVIAHCVDDCEMELAGGVFSGAERARDDLVKKLQGSRNRAIAQALGLLRRVHVSPSDLAEIEAILHRSDLPSFDRPAPPKTGQLPHSAAALKVRKRLIAAGLRPSAADDHAAKMVNRLVTGKEDKQELKRLKERQEQIEEDLAFVEQQLAIVREVDSGKSVEWNPEASGISLQGSWLYQFDKAKWAEERSRIEKLSRPKRDKLAKEWRAQRRELSQELELVKKQRQAATPERIAVLASVERKRTTT